VLFHFLENLKTRNTVDIIVCTIYVFVTQALNPLYACFNIYYSM